MFMSFLVLVRVAFHELPLYTCFFGLHMMYKRFFWALFLLLTFFPLADALKPSLSNTFEQDTFVTNTAGWTPSVAGYIGRNTSNGWDDNYSVVINGSTSFSRTFSKSFSYTDEAEEYDVLTGAISFNSKSTDQQIIFEDSDGTQLKIRRQSSLAVQCDAGGLLELANSSVTNAGEWYLVQLINRGSNDWRAVAINEEREFLGKQDFSCSFGNYSSVDMYSATSASSTERHYFDYVSVNTTSYPDYFRAYNYEPFGNNYVRELKLAVSMPCNPFSSASSALYIDGVLEDSDSSGCGAFDSFYGETYTFSPSEESSFVARWCATTDIVTSWTCFNMSFFGDIQSPSIEDLYINANTQFSSGSVETYITCTDTFPVINYYLRIDSNELLNESFRSGTTVANSTSVPDGSTNIYGSCSDPFSTSTQNTTRSYYQKTFFLWDEVDNTPFDVTNITRARVYQDDNSTYFEFNSTNNNVTYSTINRTKLRFELIYSSGDVINRYLDVSLFSNNEVLVCANKEGTPHYEQLIISSQIRPSWLENTYSNCYVAADYTRFAYQDAYLLRALTIDAPYELRTTVGGEERVLAGLDGSISSYYNLEQIAFSQSQQTINVLQSSLSFQKTSNNTIKIEYNNLANDNEDLSVSITRLDTNQVVYEKNDFSDKNSFVLFYDYTTLGGVNESTLFKIGVDAVNEEDQSIITNRYFNTQGKTGLLQTGFAITASILIVLFGLTFTASRTTFSWFGVFIIIGAIAILTFSITAWYVTFLMAVEIIMLVYAMILLTNQNYRSIA